MNIYVASSWRNDFQPGVINRLRQEGYDPYDFKNPRKDDHGFHWSEIDPEWKTWPPKSFAEALVHPLAEKGFASDMGALRSCDLCILVLPCGRSAHAEAGWAAGAGKKTIVFFPPNVPQQEPELMYKMFDYICVSSYKDLLDIVETIDKSIGCADPGYGGCMPTCGYCQRKEKRQKRGKDAVRIL